ncbi:MAG TPA: T9SS type A sorting domain-containing protein, partial [Vicingus sp.]|nr:T9SS type A sorting domain-containing protein [Vicingus sp.]
MVNTQLVNVDFTTSINEWTMDDVKVYPNPASKQLTIELGAESSNTELRIKDITGKTVLNQRVLDNKTIVPLDNFAKGVY